jgi:hypothetical protein
MKQVVAIPLEIFNVLLEKCAESDSEYQTLKNGFIIRSNGHGEEVHIRCSPDVAQEILCFADQVYSEAVPRIRQFQTLD